jgi:hypothetical protein
MIYEGAPSTHLDSIALTLIEKLKARFRCLYLNSPTMVAGMRSVLAASGLDLSAEVSRGALILSSDQSHLVHGTFDAKRMIAALRGAVHQALTDGYAGLWASGDMTWEFGNEANLSKLFDYERQLEVCMHDEPALSGVCLYHRNTLPTHAIDTALATHPAIYLSATLSQFNPHCQCARS